jgi:hypothetical protein
MNSAYKFVVAFGGVFIAGCIWSGLYPTHLNWGIHMFAFYDPAAQILFLLAGLALLFPQTQSKIVALSESAAKTFSKFPAFVTGALLCAVLCALWFAFPAKLHLLGDGALLLRSVPGFYDQPGIPESFRNQPLVWYLYKGSMAALQMFMQPAPYDVYSGIDIASGFLFIGILVWFFKRLERPAPEKILVCALLLFGGGFQFFFGYVENYVTQYVVTIAFILAGWMALEGKLDEVVPALILVLLIALNLGSLVFLPTILVLFYGRFRTRKGLAVLIMAGAGLGGAAALYAIGFNILLFFGHILGGSPDFLPVLSINSSYYPYAMFSSMHFLDWLNSELHVVPMGLGVCAILWFCRKEIDWKKPSFLFTAACAVCGFIFTWIVNSALGLARDWDLFSSFFAPLLVFSAYLLQLPIKSDKRKQILAMVVGITLLQAVGRIGVNDSEDKHLRRAMILNNTALLSLTSRMFTDEALANYFYDARDYSKARDYYKAFMLIDSSNTRILANAADSYRQTGDMDMYFIALKRAAAMNSPNPGVYSNLGVMYAQRGDTAEAIALNRKCLEMDSSESQAYANLAILYLNSGRYPESVASAKKSIGTGMNDPALYRILGKAYLAMRQYGEALGAYDTYLAEAPKDSAIKQQRDMIAQLLRSN